MDIERCSFSISRIALVFLVNRVWHLFADCAADDIHRAHLVIVHITLLTLCADRARLLDDAVHGEVKGAARVLVRLVPKILGVGIPDVHRLVEALVHLFGFVQLLEAHLFGTGWAGQIHYLVVVLATVVVYRPVYHRIAHILVAHWLPVRVAYFRANSRLQEVDHMETIQYEAIVGGFRTHDYGASFDAIQLHVNTTTRLPSSAR